MLTIGQVALRAGLRASAIRYYEAQGLLPEAPRRGGKRVYDPSILDRLAMIALAKVAGFEIAEIRSALAAVGEDPARTWRALGRSKRAEIDQQMAKLARTRDVLDNLTACRCATLEECGRAFLAFRSTHPLNLRFSRKRLSRRTSRASGQ